MKEFWATADGAIPYHYPEDIHSPRPHQGRLICNKCSLDMKQPIFPVLWPCDEVKKRKAEEAP